MIYCKRTFDRSKKWSISAKIIFCIVNTRKKLFYYCFTFHMFTNFRKCSRFKVWRLIIPWFFRSCFEISYFMQRLDKESNSGGARTVKIPGNVWFQHSEGAHYSKKCLILEIPGGPCPPSYPDVVIIIKFFCHHLI